MINAKTNIDEALVLADHLTTAVTSTTTDTGVKLYPRAAGNYKALVNWTSADYTTEDETYTVVIKVSDAVGGTYTQIGGTLTITGGTTGITEIPLSGELARYVDADSLYIQAVATLGGTTPILKYAVYLAVD